MVSEYNIDDIHLKIGVGMGGTGQFLAVTDDGGIAIIDTQKKSRIDLAWPEALHDVLGKYLMEIGRLPE